mmetsp:Transcript_12208/g.26250  ORF Transcript_12208/g.26250 Transcript_12208/m.26250 type:complete len:1102 (+) Transcript_12208:74-3379(+)|eukprot:CAMPEP_0202899294 /NCGR_PEP_ID=MMETSP1392-20130828/7567_1 /ASSEMBLY_ACC=CAM_ASM_000868 /TAXON_ID=225041 /ORGANISM="Chlamydomonas chlamydogama, Strain SAG 11-48b" /LENGTH=1101 /DNA_ID=CAMNT_0049585439 /DNA_START=57 /DNA_END=3362 /DNA_ORIENTATION=-
MAPTVFHTLEGVDISGDRFTSPLPLGPEGISHGTLENGMKYYVRKCAKPKERVAVGLAVKIGSVVEEDNEQGVAHMVEHLAFNATENYNNHRIVKFLESIGAEFGACQNAYTSADETVYQLVVPSDKPQLLSDTLAVLAEFAFKIRCAPGDISKERGAVLEEWRMSRDAAGRAQEAHWQLIMQGSRYADRLPIGKESVIRGVAPEVVRAFYERWYRPQHMAVVVVGDVADTADVVQLIQQHLGTGRSRDTGPPPAIPRFTLSQHEVPRCKVMVDKEAQDSTVFVSFKHPRSKTTTPAEFLEHLLDLLFEVALAGRLFKLSRLVDPPFVMASAAEEPLTSTIQSFVLTAVALEGCTLRALETLLTEVARVRLHGFTKREIERALREMRAEIENTFLERDQGYCWDIRDEYLRHFLNDEFVTGQEYEARLSKTLLSLITKEGVDARAAAYHPSCSCVVKVVEHKRHCTDEEVRAVVDKVVALEAQGGIPPWEEGEVPDCLLPEARLPPPGAVVSERTYSVLGATELMLSNGMRVCFKPTTFMGDEVLTSGVAFGGLTEAPEDLFFTVSMAGLIAGQLGLFGFKPSVLNDVLAGKRVELDIAEGAYTRILKGVQSPQDLEEALQLMHLLFTTNVEVDSKELEVVMAMVRQGIEAQLRNPLHHYHSRVREINYGGCYYFKTITLEALEKVDPHIACAHHNMNYRNPAEFTLVLTGNLTREELVPLLLKYLASIPPVGLPPPKKPSQLVALPFTFPPEPVVVDVNVPMVSPITQAQITFPVTLRRAVAREELVWLGLGCRLLETRLLQRLRFQYGEIYTVAVSPFFGCEAPSNTGDPRGDVSISFTCDPRNRTKLAEMALEEVQALQEVGPSQEEVDTVVNLERLQYENSQEENNYWHDLLVMGYQSKSFQQSGDLEQVYLKNQEARNKVLGEISPHTMRDSMQRLFPFPCRSRYTAIAMVPEPLPLLYRMVSALGSAVQAVRVALTPLLGPPAYDTTDMDMDRGMHDEGVALSPRLNPSPSGRHTGEALPSPGRPGSIMRTGSSSMRRSASGRYAAGGYGAADSSSSTRLMLLLAGAAATAAAVAAYRSWRAARGSSGSSGASSS